MRTDQTYDEKKGQEGQMNPSLNHCHCDDVTGDCRQEEWEWPIPGLSSVGQKGLAVHPSSELERETPNVV